MAREKIEGLYFTGDQLPRLLALAISITSEEQEITVNGPDLTIRTPTDTIRFQSARVVDGEGVVTAKRDFISALKGTNWN